MGTPISQFPGPVLGIETSCDETAVAIVDGNRRILADLVLSQLALHATYGGVVPEVAARAHLDYLDGLIRQALQETGLGFADLAGIAATAGPGLIGGLMIGTVMAKTIAAAVGLPFVAVNHLEAHALTARLTAGIPFPYLLLLVSGGHCQLLAVRGVGVCLRYGTTMDDAAGEALDKTARLLGLGYPGGPAIEAEARLAANPGRFSLPRPMMGRPGCDFSFSGLKTAVRQAMTEVADGPEGQVARAQLAHAIQTAVADVLCDRTLNAMHRFRDQHPDHAAILVAAGGVAANSLIRHRLTALAEQEGFRFVVPPPRLCTDNAAMVAWAGIERLACGLSDPLDFAPRPRWPLDPDRIGSMTNPR